jgi:transposase InsO family protein
MLMEEMPDIEIRSRLHIPERTYFRWKDVMISKGHGVLLAYKKPGPKPHHSITANIRSQIFHWRDRYGWGPTKIEGHLKAHHDIEISHRQIYKLLCETGRNRAITKPRRTWGRKRFERRHSMSLLQADWTDVRKEPKLTFIDDHSRFIPRSEIFSEMTAENSVKLFEKVIRDFGKPQQVLTDQGVQFHNPRGEKVSLFTQFCIDNGIKHIRASKGRPTTIGKIEAYHGCYRAEGWRFSTYNRWVNYWNHDRPNGAIGYKYPVEIFYRDMKTAINSG